MTFKLRMQTQSVIFLVILVPVAIMLSLHTVNATNSITCVNDTILSSTALNENLNYSGCYVIIPPNVDLNTNGYNIYAKGIIVAGNLTIPQDKNFTSNVQYLIIKATGTFGSNTFYQNFNTFNLTNLIVFNNSGNVYYHAGILRTRYFYNYGNFYELNASTYRSSFLYNGTGQSIPQSLGGSAAGSIAFELGGASDAVYSGGSTTAPGSNPQLVTSIGETFYSYGLESPETLNNYTKQREVMVHPV